MKEVFNQIIKLYNGFNDHGDIAKAISEINVSIYNPTEIDDMIAKKIMESYNDYVGSVIYVPTNDVVKNCQDSLEALNVLLVNNTSVALSYNYLNKLLPLFAPIIYSYNTFDFYYFADKVNKFMREVGEPYICKNNIMSMVESNIKKNYNNKAMFCFYASFEVIDGERSYATSEHFATIADIDNPHDEMKYTIQKHLLDSGLRPDEEYDEDYFESYEDYVRGIKCFWSSGDETSTEHVGIDIINMIHVLKSYK